VHYARNQVPKCNTVRFVVSQLERPRKDQRDEKQSKHRTISAFSTHTCVPTVGKTTEAICNSSRATTA